MTRAARRIAALVLLAAAASSASAAAAEQARIVSERPLGAGRLELTVQTPALAAPTRVQVYLPAGYDADPARRWPVAYYLHGAMGDEARFHSFYGDLIAGFPGILVAPAGGHFGFYSDWYNGGASGLPMYESYHIEQLIPLIDARLRTVAGRAGRAVIGESMGGYGVMTYAARHPDLFVAAASLSGFLDSEFPPAGLLVTATPLADGGGPDAVYGPRGAQEVRWRGHNPTDLADNLRDIDLQVRTAPGIPDLENEPVVSGLAADCVIEAGISQTGRNFHRRLVELGIAHAWKQYAAGCHTVPVFRTEFAESLPGIERALAHPRPDPRTFGFRSIEPRFKIWGWEVTADPARALEFLQMKDAGADGASFIGSGKTAVTTPPLFTRLRAVDVLSEHTTTTIAPDRGGRLRFTVDLGPAHREQQYTAASRAAGEGSAGYFTSRAVTFAPHARLLVSRVRLAPSGARACVRAVGPSVGRARIWLTDARGQRVARSRRVAVGRSARCVRLTGTHRLRAGRYTVRVTGTDRFGHRVRASAARGLSGAR